MENRTKVIGDFSRVNEEEREFINKRLDRFTKKHESDFNELHIKLDCQPYKETSRGRKAYTCKVQLDSDRGRYHADEHDFGAEKTISGALAKIERQIRKQRR